MQQTIQGRKKGGGGSAQEAPDSLRSVQTAQLIDLISEGEIEGLTNGMKSVYLDGVPVQNADGSLNFENFNFGILGGTQGQPALPGFSDVQSERAVGVEIRHSTAVTQTIVNPSVDTVRITLSVPTLTTLDTGNGNLTGAKVDFAIDIQSGSGGFVQVYASSIAGKTTSNYKRAIKLPLPGSAPWDIRVRRVTADSTSSALTDKFYWDSFTEIQSVALRYPNSAVAGITIGAQQFSRIPTRAYDLMAMRVRVPSNYDPIARTYTGVWDGTFKVAWSNNPAWVYFDLATHPRYGVGRYIKDQHLDKWRLYEIARYCDVSVDDGQGGTEPRFTCNLYIQTVSQARQALQDLAALFRAVTYWGNGGVAIVQDAPSDAVALFTKANIVGDFAYQGVSRKTRHSVWTVYYNDLARLGARVPLVYVDKDLVRQFGEVPESFSPIGCTSRGQALRLARWAAFSEAMGRTVTFRTGVQAVALGPGQVFKIADPNKAGKRLGGRVRAATTASVTMDASVTLEVGQTYQLEVMLPDDTLPVGYRTEKRQVTNGAGDQEALTVSPAFSAAPLPGTVFILQPTNIQPTWWRVVGIKPVSGSLNYDVVGIAHDPDKYAAIEQGLKLAPKPTSGLSVVSPQVTEINLTETTYIDGAQARIRVNMSWPVPAPGLTFRVSWRLALGPWNTLPDTSANSVDIDNLAVGHLEVRCTTINSLGLPSAPTSENIDLQGKVTPPEDVEGLTATVTLGGAAITWVPCTDPTYRHTVLYVGGTFESATEIWRGAASHYMWVPPVDGDYIIWARHVDADSTPSETPASFDLDYAATVGTNNALVYIFKRSASAPALPTADATYTFASGTITGLNNGWNTAPPSGSDPLYVSVATANAAGTTDTIAASDWADPVVMAVGGKDGFNAATVFLYQRTGTASAPNLPSAAVTYTFATGLASGVNNGWVQSMPVTGGSYRWVTTASALSTDATDTIAATEWAPAAVLAQDGAAGAPGANGAAGAPGAAGSNGAAGADAVGAILTNDAVSFPADAAGNVISYPGNTTTITVFKGGVDDTANWTLSFTASSGVVATRSASTVTISSVSAGVDGGYVDITAGRSGYSTITKRFSITKSKTGAQGAAGAAGANGANGATGATGATGQRGSIEAARQISGSSWSDSEAAAAISAAGYGAPVILDQVTLYNTGSYVETRYFTGSNWLTWSARINGNLLVTGSVGAAAMSVSQLSAITATIGLLRTASAGGRMEIESNRIRIFDASNALRVVVGYLL